MISGRNLQVQESGQCVFANHNQELWEKFEVESDKDGKLYFISSAARCVNKNHLKWEAWTIVYPSYWEYFLGKDEIRSKITYEEFLKLEYSELLR
jgi:hypothetical protein